MKFSEDGRGASALIGFVLLFGIAVIMMSIWQASVVPAENSRVEFNHYEQVEGDMSQLRSAYINAAETGTMRSATVTLGTTYPTRILFFNSLPPRGRIYTEMPSNGTITTDGFDVSQVCNLNSPVKTRSIKFDTDYNHLSNSEAPPYVFENTVLYTQQPDGTAVFRSDQALVQGSTLNLYPLTYNISKSGVGGKSIDIRGTDTYSTSVSGSISVTIPTTLSDEQWKELLKDEPNFNKTKQVDSQRVRIVLSDASWDVQCAAIGSPPPVPGGVLSKDETIVYDGLNAIAGNGSKNTSLAAKDVQALGPPGTDIDGDGSGDLPYVDDEGNLTIVDSAGNNKTLVSEDAPSEPATEKTLMAVGKWNGSPTSVFYTNDDKDTIFRVDSSGSVTEVAKPGNGAQAVMGFGDIDGDSKKELIFADSSQQVRYIDQNGNTKKLKGGGVGSNNGIGVGKPPDFNNDGKARALIVTGSNNVKIVGKGNGNDKTITKANAKKAPLTAADADNDGNLEIVYVGTSGYLKYVDNPINSPMIKTLKDDGGNKIKGDGELGVVS